MVSTFNLDIPTDDADIFTYVEGAYNDTLTQPGRIRAKFAANTTQIKFELDQGLFGNETKFVADTVAVPLDAVTQVKIITYGKILSVSYNNSVVLRAEIDGHFYGNSTILIASSKLTHVVANLRLREVSPKKDLGV
jgi:hypothetical protein